MSNRSNANVRSALRAACEPLERRQLLSTIAWPTRGSATNDSDGLNALFGANSGNARFCIDRAIADWEEVISDFKFANGTNTFTLTVTTANLSGNVADSSVTLQLAGKPYTGTLRLDTGTTHYVDPEIGDDAEFTTITNAFTGFAPGIVGVDLYATALHEIGHLMGFTQNTSLLLSNYCSTTSIDDPYDDDPGNLVAVNIGGGPIEATMTNADTGHLWEGPGTAATNAAGLPSFPDVLMNPGRVIKKNERNLISDFEASLLAQVYGYTIKLPSTINNMLVNPNFTSNALTVNGQAGSVNDLILVEHLTSPNAFLVTINTVGGGGTTYTEIVPFSETDTITVNGNDGNDIIRMEYNNGKPTTVDGGNGNDFFDFSFGLKNLSNITGSTTVIGGNDSDQIFIYDNSITTAKVFTVTNTRFDRSGWGGLAYGADMEQELLTTGTAADSISIQSTTSTGPLTVNSAGGNDGISLGNTTNGVRSILGGVQIQNDPAFSTVVLNDTSDSTGRNWQINDQSSGLGGISGLAPALISWDNADIADISLFCGSGSDNGFIAKLSETLYINNLIAGANDAIQIGSTSAGGMTAITQGHSGGLTIDNSATYTALTFEDSASNVARNITLSYNTDDGYFQPVGLGSATIRFSNGGVNNVTFRMSTLADTINFPNAVSASGPWTFDGGGGTDTLVLNSSTNNSNRVIGVSATGITGSQFIFPLTSIEALDLYTGAGNDQVTVASIASTTAFRYFAGNGTDSLQLGGSGTSWSGQVNGTVTFFGEGGTDSLVVTDTDYAAASPAPACTLINGRLTSSLGRTVNFDSLTENFQFDARTAGGTSFTVPNYLNTQHLYLHGQLNSPTADFLYIDDRTMVGPPNNPSSVEIYPNQIKRFFSTQPTVPHLIDYDGWESPTYYGNTANANNIKIYGVSSQVPAAYQYSVFGGTAADTVTVYPHDASGNLTINANLGISGDASYDTITFDDTTGTTGINYVFYNPFGGGQTNVAGIGTRGIGFGNDFEDATIKGGSGNDNVRIDAYLGTTRLTYFGGNGSDSIDYTPSTKNLATGIRNRNVVGFDGQGGTDRATIWNDSNTSGWFYQNVSGSMLIDRTDGLASNDPNHVFYQLTALNTENTVVRGGSAADSFYNNNSNTAQPMEVHGGAGLDVVGVTSGRVVFAEYEDLASLNVSSGGQAAISSATPTTLYLQALFVFGTGTMDLNDADMIYDYSGGSQLDQVRQMIVSARNNGSWTGSGLTSTTAKDNIKHNTMLGFMEATDYKSMYPGATAYGGVPIDNTAVIVKYTYYGDANFNGKVDGADLGRFDLGFAQHRTGWMNGDFNGDGKVNGSDIGLIDFAFGTQGGVL